MAEKFKITNSDGRVAPQFNVSPGGSSDPEGERRAVSPAGKGAGDSFTFADRVELALAPAVKFVYGLFGASPPKRERMPAIKILAAAGMTDEDGRVKESKNRNYRKLPQLASQSEGGLPRILEEAGGRFQAGDGKSSAAFRFLAERSGFKTEGAGADRKLALLYLKHLSAAIEGEVDANLLLLVMESLRYESGGVRSAVGRLVGLSRIKAAAAKARFADGKGIAWQGHPLFARGPDDSATFSEALFEKGFRRVPTHDGSLLLFREETDLKTGHARVVIAGDPEILGEMAERLSAANGGMVAPYLEGTLFPLSSAVEFIAGAARRRIFAEDGAVHFASAADFANETAIEAGVDLETLMPELVFSASPVDVSAVRNFHGLSAVPPLDAGLVSKAWSLTLGVYLDGLPFERVVLESSGADSVSLREAFERVSYNVSEEAAAAIEAMLAPARPESAVRVTDARSNGSGVSLGRNGNIEKVIVRLVSPVGETTMTAKAIDGEFIWSVVAPSMPLKQKARLANLVESVFMGTQRFRSWRNPGDEPDAEDFPWALLPDATMDLGVMEMDPEIIFEDPSTFLGSGEWKSGLFLSRIENLSEGFPSSAVSLHIRDIAARLAELLPTETGAHEAGPHASGTIARAAAAIAELFAYRPDVIEDANLVSELIEEIERHGARRKRSSGEALPMAKFAGRLLENDLDHGEVHSLIAEILLAAPRRIFDSFKEELLPGEYWEHERERAEDEIGNAAAIVSVNSKRFPGFEKAWKSFRNLYAHYGEKASEEDFVLFLKIDAGLTFDRKTLLLEPEGLGWATRRHALLSQGEMSGRFALAGELVSALVHHAGGNSFGGGNPPFGDTVDATRTPGDSAKPAVHDENISKKSGGSKGGQPWSSGPRQTAATVRCAAENFVMTSSGALNPARL